MKKLIQLIFAGMMILPMSLNAQQNPKCFVKQYKNQNGFTVITFGKPAMNMISLIAKAGDEKEIAQLFKRVDGIQILAFERRNDKAPDETFISEMLAFCKDNRYEEMVEVVGPDETVLIYGKTEGKTITGLMILNRTNRGNSTGMVSLTGNFTADDLNNLCMIHTSLKNGSIL